MPTDPFIEWKVASVNTEPLLLFAEWGRFSFQIIFEERTPYHDTEPFVLSIWAGGEERLNEGFNDPFDAMKKASDFMDRRGWEGDANA